MLTAQELGVLLKHSYDNALRGEQVVNIHLFGIDHSEAIAQAGIREVIEASGLPTSLKVELNKGVNLGKYVQRRHRI